MVGMDTADLASARRAVVAAFRWVDGHADLAAVLRDARVLGVLGPALAAPFRDAGVTAVASPEARGFVLGALVATSLSAGLVLVRKEGGRHPGPTISVRTAPDWRGRELLLRLHPDELAGGDRVLVVDDWVETGNQARAAFALIRACGATPVGTAALVDDCDAPTRQELALRALVRSRDLPPSS
jgi:adenine phosphoribosyltransferase